MKFRVKKKQPYDKRKGETREDGSIVVIPKNCKIEYGPISGLLHFHIYQKNNLYFEDAEPLDDEAREIMVKYKLGLDIDNLR